MPVRAEWTDESRTILITHFEGSWTITEFAQVLQDIKGMIKEVPHPVYAIAVGQNSRVPRTGNLLPHLRNLFLIPLAHIVAVPSTSSDTAVLSLFTQLSPDWHDKITFADSVEAAHAIIAEKRDGAAPT